MQIRDRKKPGQKAFKNLIWGRLGLHLGGFGGGFGKCWRRFWGGFGKVLGRFSGVRKPIKNKKRIKTYKPYKKEK